MQQLAGRRSGQTSSRFDTHILASRTVRLYTYTWYIHIRRRVQFVVRIFPSRMNHSNVSRARVPNRSRAFKDTLIGVESQLRWLAGSPRIYPCDTAARRRRKSHGGHDGRGREGGGAERGRGRTISRKILCGRCCGRSETAERLPPTLIMSVRN